jgi:hypothetical protein
MDVIIGVSVMGTVLLISIAAFYFTKAPKSENFKNFRDSFVNPFKSGGDSESQWSWASLNRGTFERPTSTAVESATLDRLAAQNESISIAIDKELSNQQMRIPSYSSLNLMPETLQSGRDSLRPDTHF